MQANLTQGIMLGLKMIQPCLHLKMIQPDCLLVEMIRLEKIFLNKRNHCSQVCIKLEKCLQEDKELMREVQWESEHLPRLQSLFNSETTLYDFSRNTDSLSRKKYKKQRCEHLRHLPLEPTVLYWTGNDDFGDSQESSGHYSCYQSSSYYSGALHTAILGLDAPLFAGAKYSYRVGDRNYGWSDDLEFVMPPAIGAASTPYRYKVTLSVILSHLRKYRRFSIQVQ